MELVKAEDVKAHALGFDTLPVLRQIALMIGLGISVALGVAVAMWSQAPDYSMLYGDLSARDLAEVTQTLDSAAIPYEIELGGGAIMVPADRISEARMKLATQGLPKGGEVGFELLEKDQGFGSSSFLQKARYNHALEGELAQSISRLNLVQSARVHLAIPKQSAFARRKSKPAVSVLLNLYPGRTLDEKQVAGIVSMVASSVPGLDAEQVTVIDQKGHLLSSSRTSGDMLLSSTQFDYTRRLEERYAKRIVDIISPIVGLDGVQAQVVADIDFTSQEQTRESYLPEQKAVRSEQLYKTNSDNSAALMGIPGALSNQPPVAGSTTDENVDEISSSPRNTTERTVRNYELDRTISHTRPAPAVLKRLSVAVVVDYRSITDKKGKVERVPLEEKEMAYITSLVKETVGLKESRNDTISVVNTAFQFPTTLEPLPEPPWWEQPWVFRLLKQVIGGLAVLVIAFGILRPMLGNLASQGKAEILALPAGNAANQLILGQGQPALINQTGASGQQLAEMAGSIAKDDPKRVAQVMNNWVASDG